ncbi:MAG: methylenetetrahydrofolate--tRNA-(uracil(54)-C(5))-methyltransferase (FADH(2)-oxidizing) TrmFO [Firmicutes bacterium]|nr:methylenetetrahydrofolate--tRNA-(uracil(54)-C(5))-methyltransferase (FADH(2)-oxidizing) TrmFO [Bacillota bacterium]
MPPGITIIGAGLAGSEAAWQAARRGISVKLHEMRPGKTTPAHHTGLFAELVCSNSLRANNLENAVGLLKEEMRRMDSLVIRCADSSTVPAGGALAVDRRGFSGAVTAALRDHPRVEVINTECHEIPPEGVVIVATGPLTSPALSEAISRLTGSDYFYFFDAAAPIVTAESVDAERAFWASRYGRGEADYLNCPLEPKEYQAFWEALVHAERAPLEAPDRLVYFEGCLPVEVIAERGPETLLFGPMKPVGLIDPATGRQPHAVAQLRREDREGQLLNLVGFQTRLKWGEQERVFRMIPALANAEFVRFGVMHRNSFINSPRLLLPTYQLKADPRLFFAGQLTGVEGYVESAASGLVAGLNAARHVLGEPPLEFPAETMLGALPAYITSAAPDNFQPLHANFGLVPPLGARLRSKKVKNRALSERALAILERFMKIIN